MSSQTIRQRSGIEQYQAVARTSRSDFRAIANARGFTCAPAMNDTPHVEDTSFGAWCLAILSILAFVVVVSQVMRLGEVSQVRRDAVHACEAQGLRAITVNDGVNDHIVCSAGAL